MPWRARPDLCGGRWETSVPTAMEWQGVAVKYWPYGATLGCPKRILLFIRWQRVKSYSELRTVLLCVFLRRQCVLNCYRLRNKSAISGVTGPAGEEKRQLRTRPEDMEISRQSGSLVNCAKGSNVRNFSGDGTLWGVGRRMTLPREADLVRFIPASVRWRGILPTRPASGTGPRAMRRARTCRLVIWLRLFLCSRSAQFSPWPRP